MGDAGPSAFAPDEIMCYILGLLNTPIVQTVLTAINPTINYQVGTFRNTCILIEKYEKIDSIVRENLKMLDLIGIIREKLGFFKRHPLLIFNESF
jgi:hypothetical protein